MPNWCHNTIEIKGNTEDVTNFLDAITVKEDDGTPELNSYGYKQYDLSALYPIPDELQITAQLFTSTPDSPEATELHEKYEANREKHGYAHWYEWCIAKWGTKWSPNVTTLEFHDNGDGTSVIIGSYETAWSPATGLLAGISEKHPSLVFLTSFDEEASMFVGAEAFVAGKVFGCSYTLPPVDDEGMPEEFLARINKAEKGLEEIGNDWGHEDWDELTCDLRDAHSDLRGHCEMVSQELLDDWMATDGMSRA